MKNFIFYLIFSLSVLFTNQPAFSQTVTITLEDLKIFRQAQVDAVSYKKEAEEAKRQSAEWETSAKNWKSLFEAEKLRADNVQAQALKECDASKVDLAKANFQLHRQADEDREKIGNLQFDIRKLKANRKWVFTAGFGTGLAIGGYTGYKIGNLKF